MLSSSKFFSSYSRWDEVRNCYETWNDSVARVMTMHREKFADKMSPQLSALLDEAQEAYNEQLVLGAQRALQFGGPQLRKHEAKMYNCSASYADRVAFFQEAMYLLLCGCGVGFSVQRRHIKKLPALVKRGNELKSFLIEDSIEGWADAFGVLLSSYFEEDGTFPEFKGYRIHFDFSQIRPRGAKISGGFKAPGPDGLRNALIKCEELLEREFSQQGRNRIFMRPIVAYDFVMHQSDAVLAGGVRRSATLCMFDKDDQEMLKAKTGDWNVTNPQRARSNNSVVLKRDEVTYTEWVEIFSNVRQFGEPGFVFVDDYDTIYNPCVEIGMRAVSSSGESGFQFCNLVETNGALCTTKEAFFRACRAGAILSTIQAGYTDFKYLSKATRDITEREALIGVSITGWMNNPQILFDEETLRQGAEIVKQVNREVAALIGINPAARTTCGKPAGNASTLLGTAAGVHGEHAPRYFRNVQLNKDEEVAQLLEKTNPKMLENSVWSANGTDFVASFPIEAPANSIFKSSLLGVRQLDYVKKAQQIWVESGTNVELCTSPSLRHNISNTISVDNWDEVGEYLWMNRQWFAGVSLLSASGDRDYAQAPYTEVFTAEQLVAMYGRAAIVASGLIVDGLHAFNNNLWAAVSCAQGQGEKLAESSESLLKRDWVRRFSKFADKFFEGDIRLTGYCLKDVHNFHRWESIVSALQPVDFSKELGPKSFIDVNTLGAQACSGGVCEWGLH